MQTILKKYNIRYVWHFTDLSNVASIMRHGLLSLAEAGERGIAIPKPGGNDLSHNLDRALGLDRYVHLTFIGDDHPMLYHANQEGRIPEPVWLKIDSSIILYENVLFCPEIANSTGARLLNAEQAKTGIDFEALFANEPWKNPKLKSRWYPARKSEILIPNLIPPNNIINTE